MKSLFDQSQGDMSPYRKLYQQYGTAYSDLSNIYNKEKIGNVNKRPKEKQKEREF
jgi:hypothetical protein